MPRLIPRSCLLLFALPALAMADPVTITTHSSGTTQVRDTVLIALGLDDTVTADELPFELTLTTTLDLAGPAPGRNEWARDEASALVVDFRIGSQRYTFNGSGMGDAIAYTVFGNDGYQHDLAVQPFQSSYTVVFSHVFTWPAGSLGEGGALVPRDVASGAGGAGYMNITAYPRNPDAPGSWGMYGEASTLSLQVVSAVPEPAPFVMLAAGVLALGLRRRLGRVAP